MQIYNIYASYYFFLMCAYITFGWLCIYCISTYTHTYLCIYVWCVYVHLYICTEIYIYIYSPCVRPLPILRAWCETLQGADAAAPRYACDVVVLVPFRLLLCCVPLIAHTSRSRPPWAHGPVALTGIRASSFFLTPAPFPPPSVPLCVSVYVRVFIIQGHSLAPHGSIPYPGHHGYRGHLSQRVPADQTGVHPDDVSPPAWLLGTFVRHNAQVLVADREKTSRAAKTLSWCPSLHWCVCVCVCASLHSFFCASSPHQVQFRVFIDWNVV